MSKGFPPSRQFLMHTFPLLHGGPIAALVHINKVVDGGYYVPLSWKEVILLQIISAYPLHIFCIIYEHLRGIVHIRSVAVRRLKSTSRGATRVFVFRTGVPPFSFLLPCGLHFNLATKDMSQGNLRFSVAKLGFQQRTLFVASEFCRINCLVGSRQGTNEQGRSKHQHDVQHHSEMISSIAVRFLILFLVEIRPLCVTGSTTSGTHTAVPDQARSQDFPMGVLQWSRNRAPAPPNDPTGSMLQYILDR